MTEALKPRELFGLRWRSLDDQNALPLYRNGVAANAYAPEETNTIMRDASVALFAYGVADDRPNDSFGLGTYHNGISQPLKDDIKRLTGAAAAVKNENWLEVSYDFAITPAIRLIPSYQHIWKPGTPMGVYRFLRFRHLQSRLNSTPKRCALFMDSLQPLSAGTVQKQRPFYGGLPQDIAH